MPQDALLCDFQGPAQQRVNGSGECDSNKNI